MWYDLRLFEMKKCCKEYFIGLYIKNEIKVGSIIVAI